ncbi:uncharacterized protein LOC144137837 isoform X1 [Haemaphysalis longicornis]
MDQQPSGAGGASASGSQRKAPKRPRCTRRNGPASLAPEERPGAQPRALPGPHQAMAFSELMARLLANWGAFKEEDSADSEDPEKDFDNPASAPSFSPDSADLESPDDEDFRDFDSPEEDSEGNEKVEEGPMDNDSPTEEDSEAPKSGKPGELVSLAVLKRLKGHFTGATLDCQLPCTAAEGRVCQIFDHLSAWNEFLCQVSLQLREMTGAYGNLSLVFFCETTLMEYPSEQRHHQIYTLVYWLLKTHRCILCVEVDVPHLEPYSHLVCDALQGNLHVRSLKLSFGGCSAREDQAPDIRSMTHLRELQCTGYLKPTESLVSKLAHLLRTSTSLTVLRISGMPLKGPSVEDFFRALGENRFLEELALPDSTVAKATPAARALFAEFLKNTASLKTLSFAADRKVYTCLQWILEGLVENKSVVSASFKGLPVDRAAIRLMVEIFAKNRVLRSFAVSCKHGYRSDLKVEDPPTKSDFGRLHKALVQNDTLEQVSLPIEFWNVQQWKALFEALPTKDSLKTLTIEARDGSTPLVLDVSAALEETDAEEKVSFKASLMVDRPEKIFDCKAFSEAVVYADDRNSDAVCEFLKHLPSLGHIKSLQLELGDIKGGREFSSAFTTFLRDTRTLKTLRIGAPWEGSLSGLEDTIAKGSLTKVCIRVDQVRSHFTSFAKPLAEAINSSKNISRVKFEVDQNPYAEHAFLQRLSLGIRNNYALLSVDMGSVDKTAEVYWFRVWNVMCRNQGLVMAAADFVRGVRRDRHCALAMEQVHRHPKLVEEVARLESVDETWAAAMVREGFRTMASMPDFV